MKIRAGFAGEARQGGRKRERPWVLGHVPAFLALILLLPPYLKPWRRGAWLEGSLSGLAAGHPQIHQPQIQDYLSLPFFPAPWVLVGTGTGAGIPPGSLSWFVTPHWWCRPTAAATTSGPDTAPGSWSAHCRALTCAHVGSSRSSPARRCGPWPGPGRREAPRRGHEAEGRDAVGQGEPVQLQ